MKSSDTRRSVRREARRKRLLRRRVAMGVLAVSLLVVAIIVLLSQAGDSHVSSPSAAAAYHDRHHDGSTATSHLGRAGVRRAVSQPVEEAVESPEVRKLIALGKPIYCAGPHGNEVALTFDDGPGQYTWLAIPKLRKHHIKATFFIVGRNIPLLPRALREERALGAVGDHTFTHPLLTSLSQAEAESEIVRAQLAVKRASGGPVFLFRPPYGALDATIDGIAHAHNLLPILWTIDSRDSLGANYAEIERNVIEGLHPGAIILMHENHGQTIRAMLSIFAAIARKHLRTVSVPRLLTDDPPTEAQVRAGGSGCGGLFHPGTGG